MIGHLYVVLKFVEYVDRLPIARARKAEWLKDKCCSKCGSTADLLIEYPDPKHSFAVWIWANVPRREAVLLKAGVWCPEHYRERMSQKRTGVVLVHGIPQMYRQGCRCELCRAAIAKYQRERMERLGS